MDINSDVENWYCQESVIVSNGDRLFKSTVRHHYIKEIDVNNNVITPVTSMVEEGLKVSTTEDELYFNLSVLMSIEKVELPKGFVELPTVIECEGDVSYSAPSANGYILNKCYFEYSKHI